MKALTRKTRIKLPPERSAPDISPDIPNLTATDDILMGPEVVVRDCIVENVVAHDCSLKSVILERCILRRVSFAQSRIASLSLKDVRLVECDFANAEANALKAVRVEFLNCRLTGFRAV